jgi:tetratricopeptide (TPR) repeat protein/RNA polymerase subunit RPABC4/transcription elongation factor Spt4
VAYPARDSEVIGLAETTENGASIEDFEFDCPECGTHIHGEVNRCPKCGVEFVIEEVAEVECPKCRATIPSESETCPKCGQSFAAVETPQPMEEPKPAPSPEVKEEPKPAPEPEVTEEDRKADQLKELREEFSQLVSEVAPLLSLAKDNSIDITATRRLVDKAVALGKRREIEPAVKTLRECREITVRALNDRLERDITYLESLVGVAQKMGSDHQQIDKVMSETKKHYAAKDFAKALEEARTGKKLAEQLTGRYVESHELYEALEKLILNSERFYLDVREARKLLNEARDAGESGDWTTMGILSRKGREELNKALPELLTVELRKAKQILLDDKSNGKDVTAMVKILKDAGVSMKREKYEEALERLTEFYSEQRTLA